MRCKNPRMLDVGPLEIIQPKLPAQAGFRFVIAGVVLEGVEFVFICACDFVKVKVGVYREKEQRMKEQTAVFEIRTVGGCCGLCNGTCNPINSSWLITTPPLPLTLCTGCGHVLTALGLSPPTSRMRAWKAVASTLVLSGADVVVTTLLYAHGRRGQDILQDLRHFNIFNSLLDIWGGCLYRSCVLLGAAIGVATNTAYGPRRLRASRTFIAVVCLLMGIYMMVKLLLYSEVRRTIRDPWFWGLFAWTYVALVATFGLWQLLACVTSSREALGHGSESRTEAEESCDAPRDKREEAAGPTIHKLLSYTKPDAVFLGIASFFLLVAALGK